MIKIINRKARGMSMLEILIYFAIVGVLVAAMKPTIMKLWSKVASFKHNSVLTTWDSMIREYHLEQGVYPSRIEDLYERPSDPKLANTWHKYTTGNEEKPDNLQYNRPPQIFGDIYRKYELFIFDDADIDNASRDNIVSKVGA